MHTQEPVILISIDIPSKLLQGVCVGCYDRASVHGDLQHLAALQNSVNTCIPLAPAFTRFRFPHRQRRFRGSYADMVSIA